MLPESPLALDIRGLVKCFDRPAVDRIDHTLDALRERFGRDAIRRGTADGLHDLDWRGDDLRR